MNDYQTRLAELSLIRSLPLMVTGKIQGKVKSQMNRIARNVDKYYKTERYATNEDIKIVQKAIEEFGEQSGWTKKQKDIATLILFGQTILEDSKFEYPPGILDALTELILFFEDHPVKTERPAPACYWAGQLAAEKWQRIVKAT